MVQKKTIVLKLLWNEGCESINKLLYGKEFATLTYSSQDISKSKANTSNRFGCFMELHGLSYNGLNDK